MVNFPKTRRTYCPGCGHHTECTVSQYKKNQERSEAQGRRRYDRKQKGFGGQTRPKFHKNAKTTKKVVLKLTCQECHKISQQAFKRAGQVQLGAPRICKKCVVF